MDPVGLAEVFATFGAAYLRTRSLPRGGAKVWRAIVSCRTAARRAHRYLQRLRGNPAHLSLVPEPALPALSDTRQGGVARRPTT